MFTSLLLKYPNAIVQNHIPATLTSDKIWFQNPAEEEYIGIDRSEMKEAELDLLQCLFKELTNTSLLLNESPRSQEWFSFLFEDGISPSYIENEYRVIQFTIKNRVDQQLMKEAFDHLLPHNTILVLADENKGLLIEEKGDWNLNEEQLISFSHVIESDFFVSISFFIGQFHTINSHFPLTFNYEKELFSFSTTMHHHTLIQSVVTVLPSFTLSHIPKEWKKQIFAKMEEVFLEDHELIHTVTVFLENQSNISQTAKKLFMHRNTVQYRIDKFIEKTRIDIKTFQGALLAYLACLDFESDNLPKKND